MGQLERRCSAAVTAVVEWVDRPEENNDSLITGVQGLQGWQRAMAVAATQASTATVRAKAKRMIGDDLVIDC